MAHMICLESEEGEVFVNLDQVCEATATPGVVEVCYANSETNTFHDAAAHTLIQALRHEQTKTAQQG
ncbi:unnamed protein product [marine sediment metagenome]|uniref:Uncharacterized protein n=1 Tax=marine sediment metagenome TaxID=412755 RepID=X0W6J4_9ZZZZ